MKNIFFENINKALKDKKIPRVDLHTHTNWTDGENTLVEMFDAAKKQNLDYIFFSEHSRKSSVGWFDEFVKDVKNLDDKKCKAYAGTEVKVLNLNGDLDLNEDIEKKSDFIMASVHRFPGEKGNIIKKKSKLEPVQALKIEYELSMAAIENPKTLILGHPFGMSLKRFNAVPEKKKFIDIIKKCKLYNKVFEVNANYHPDINFLIDECLKENTLISLGSNAHNIRDVGKILNLIQL